MNHEMAANEIIDSIAAIEMRRHQAEKRSGSAAAGATALHSLQELLDGEQEALRQLGPNTEYSANIAVLTIAIGKVKGTAGSPNRPSAPISTRRGPLEPSRQVASHDPPKNHGRRTMGRTSGR